MPPSSTRQRRGRRWLSIAVVGSALLLSGLAFHAVSAYYRPGGPQPLSTSAQWAFLSWGWLRLAAWGAVAAGAWLLAAAWTKRRGGNEQGAL